MLVFPKMQAQVHDYRHVLDLNEIVGKYIVFPPFSKTRSYGCELDCFFLEEAYNKNEYTAEYIYIPNEKGLSDSDSVLGLENVFKVVKRIDIWEKISRKKSELNLGFILTNINNGDTIIWKIPYVVKSESNSITLNYYDKKKKELFYDSSGILRERPLLRPKIQIIDDFSTFMKRYIGNEFVFKTNKTKRLIFHDDIIDVDTGKLYHVVEDEVYYCESVCYMDCNVGLLYQQLYFVLKDSKGCRFRFPIKPYLILEEENELFLFEGRKRVYSSFDENFMTKEDYVEKNYQDSIIQAELAYEEWMKKTKAERFNYYIGKDFYNYRDMNFERFVSYKIVGVSVYKESLFNSEKVKIRIQKDDDGAQYTLDSGIRGNAELSKFDDYFWGTTKPSIKFPKIRNWKLVKEGEIRIGMNRDEVEMSWGVPYDINTTITSNGTHEQWVYRNKGYVYFNNGIVDSIQY